MPSCWSRWSAALRDGLTLRVFFGIALPLVVLTVAFDAVDAWQQGRRVTGLLLDNGTTAARLLARNARLPVYADDRQQLEDLARLILEDRFVAAVCVYDADGRRLVGSTRPLAGAPDSCADTDAEAPQRGHVAETADAYLFREPIWGRVAAGTTPDDLYFGPPSAAEVQLGHVAVHMTRQGVEENAWAFLWEHLVLSAGFLVLAGLATLLVVTRVLGPLRRLARSAGQLAGDAGQPRDTYAQLVQGLDRAFAAVAHLNQTLESRVAERTAALEQLNRELQAARDHLEEGVRERTVALEATHRQLLQAEKLSAIGQISASVAHEFNNPICGIRNVLSELKRAALDPEEQGLADLALAECDRVARLIHDLQQFSRPSSGTRVPVDLHRALETMLRLSAKDLQRTGIEVERDFAAELPPVPATEDQLKQVFLNLVSNARDAMAVGGGTLRVATARANGHVRVQVEDSGPGVPPEHRERIFEPFFSTKPAVKGTGLGLAVSFGIVRRHGGTIQVDEAAGGGARFTVTLPLEEEVP